MAGLRFGPGSGIKPETLTQDVCFETSYNNLSLHVCNSQGHSHYTYTSRTLPEGTKWRKRWGQTSHRFSALIPLFISVVCGLGFASVCRPYTLISIWTLVSCVQGLLSPCFFEHAHQERPSEGSFCYSVYLHIKTYEQSLIEHHRQMNDKSTQLCCIFW